MDITAPNNKTMSFRMLFEDSWRETVNETISDTYKTYANRRERVS